MELSASQLNHLPIMSLQSNESPGYIVRPAVLIANLQVVALLCRTHNVKELQLIRIQDIRQVSPEYLIIDNDDDIVTRTDVVRLQPVIAHNYDPIGQPVVTESGRLLGAVKDYLIDPQTSRITSLQLRPKLLSARLTRHARITRQQIAEITRQKITVHDSVLPTGQFTPSPLPDPTA